MSLLDGDIHPNPGPARYPCRDCNKAVRSNQKGIQCDGCDQWYHIACIDMSVTTYHSLSDPTLLWNCHHCELCHFSDSFFDPESDDANTQTSLADEQLIPSHSTKGSINISGLFFNARSIKNKTNELWAFLESEPPDILGMAETWLTPNDITIEPLLQRYGYTSFRRDRKAGKGGGVFAGVKSALSPRHVPELEHPDLELLCIEITVNSNKWLVCILYRQPNATAEFWDNFQAVVDSVQLKVNDHQGVIIVGDFNVNWRDTDAPNVHHLTHIVSTMDMVQLIDNITRQCPQDPTTGSIIDLLFTNQIMLVEASTGPNPVGSDHLAISFKVSCSVTQPTKSLVRQFLSYKQGDFEHFNNLLSLARWSLFMDVDNVDDAWDGFLDLFDAAACDAIPRKRCRSKRSCPWIDDEIKHLISKKRTAFHIAKRSGTVDKWDLYKMVRNKVKQAVNISYSRYINKLFCDTSDNKKRFFSFVRREKIPHLSSIIKVALSVSLN